MSNREFIVCIGSSITIHNKISANSTIIALRSSNPLNGNTFSRIKEED